MINVFIATLTLGQCVFTAHILSLRAKHTNVYLPLAGFFMVLVIFHSYHIAKAEVFASSVSLTMPNVMLLKQLVELSLAPLFWIYIRELTSEASRELRLKDTAHFLIPFFSSILFASIVSLFSYQQVSLSTVGSNFPLFVNRLNEVLNVIILMQLFGYSILILRHLIKYRLKLKSLFSNENNLIELKWLGALIGFIFATAVLELASQFVYFSRVTPDDFYIVLNSILRAVIVWFLATWGLSHRPELLIELEKEKKSPLVDSKYRKSAIGKTKRVAIAAKISAVFEDGKLYRDSNLSLRQLAEKIQELPSYVSQTLSLELKESFFDYVNNLRVVEAKLRLESTDDTVEMISIEVGYNSRSSFYKAFKKVTGQTPAAYRKSGLNNKLDSKL